MNLVCAPSRAGPPYCRADERYLHSPYDPKREAERWLETRLSPKAPTCIVLLAPCLDYLSAPLRRHFPRSRILSVQPDPYFRGKELGASDAHWYPDSPRSLRSFFDVEIGEDEVSGVLVLEWQPGSQAFPEGVSFQREELRLSLDRLAGSAATVKTFGLRWFSNACRSFLLVEQLGRWRKIDRPLVIAAAGPSLEPSLSALAPYRERYALIAVSSALATCRAWGLEPELVVATDGGFWSRAHLYPLAARKALVATPLTALPSAQLWPENGLFLLDQGSFVERALLPFLGGGLPSPPHGTVAGSALGIGAALSTGALIVAGLDLAVECEREHASPHAFEPIVLSGRTRLSPLAGARYGRMLDLAPSSLGNGTWRFSRSMRSYAQVLAEDARALEGRLFRMTPSPVELPGFATLTDSELARLLGDAPAPTAALALETAPTLSSRRALLERAFSRWREEARNASAALAGGTLPNAPATRELFRSFDLPDWAAARRAALAGADPRPAALALAARVEESLAELEERLLG